MDYLTKSASREDMRALAVLFRNLFHAPEKGRFPALTALELVPDVFPGTAVKIVSDNELPKTVPARCYPDENGNFTVEIRATIYIGAYEKEIGAFRGFIVHELCHIFLYKAGFTPVFNMQFGNNEIPAYCSVEWQAKALCGEVMMPYAETEHLSKSEIIRIYGVSKGFAEKRKTY